MELAVGCGGPGFPAQILQMLLHPPAEGQGLRGAVEDEDRRPLHVVALDGAEGAAGEVEGLHAPVVGGHQGALGGGQGNQELALGVLAPDGQRPREGQRNLGHTGEVLDVAPRDPRVEGILADVVQGHAGGVLHEGSPGGDDGRGGVVVLDARHGLQPGGGGAGQIFAQGIVGVERMHCKWRIFHGAIPGSGTNLRI